MIKRYTGSPKEKRRVRRHIKVRGKIHGTAAKPRASVFRSSRHVYVQVIDDDAKKTMLAASDHNLTEKDKKLTKLEQAHAVGKHLGQKLHEQKIAAVVFDRGGYKYHGRVKALADGIREAGIQF